VDTQAERRRRVRLSARFDGATRTAGRPAFAWTLSGLPTSVLQLLGAGEWLDVHASPDGVRPERARVLEVDAAAGALVVEWRGDAPPPSPGTLQPSLRSKLIEQKRAIVEELTEPRGNLAHIVRLVADPESMAPARPVCPARFAQSLVGGNA